MPASPWRSSHLEETDRLEDSKLPRREIEGDSSSASPSFVLFLRLKIGLTSFLKCINGLSIHMGKGTDIVLLFFFTSQSILFYPTLKNCLGNID